ncbi:hypothetical protein ATCV1_z668R [Acanthocystis turfacea chlorella virus 1]|uniref:Uncharacterized protein z668R n=1 Tax=Chlorovirus heliozoae TaxID=322019 RepID=A7K9S8_9PHYC|nr:hypothetical protein ATCV1_z668R [Acanthocystis turfacea chlorella virus 1]ABT16802.1 hypothetical protein ATCV1_z668R [Acanthocystis turfacea chlorella virus 1]
MFPSVIVSLLLKRSCNFCHDSGNFEIICSNFVMKSDGNITSSLHSIANVKFSSNALFIAFECDSFSL